mmetsp:Transcript_6166/g.15199  ORF Transcript_6166/g.15199 Transcript_6166/m.15199 type:complete len:211 (-) Transcript_6166:2958-3590(-)
MSRRESWNQNTKRLVDLSSTDPEDRHIPSRGRVMPGLLSAPMPVDTTPVNNIYVVGTCPRPSSTKLVFPLSGIREGDWLQIVSGFEDRVRHPPDVPMRTTEWSKERLYVPGRTANSSPFLVSPNRFQTENRRLPTGSSIYRTPKPHPRVPRTTKTTMTKVEVALSRLQKGGSSPPSFPFLFFWGIGEVSCEGGTRTGEEGGVEAGRCLET